LATDTFILKGDPAGETFEPHFTYHGFQFVEVTGWPGVPTLANFAQVHFHTANALRTTFSSSSPVLNAIQNSAVKGQASNMMTVPTDCDQVWRGLVVC
jgi:alpha-L-rhamnosidase